MILNSDEIFSLFKSREKALMPYHAAAKVLQDVYEGNFTVELPEIDTSEQTAAANLIQSGLDQHAMRISSVMPSIMCPSMSPSKTSQKRANQRRLSIQAWWYMNRLQIKLPRRARHLAGLGMSPVVVRPGPDNYPIWEVRHPLETYPAPSGPDDLVPLDCIFRFERDAKWLKDRYPDYAASLGRETTDDKKVTCLQFISAEQFALIAIHDDDERTASMMLGTTANRAGVPTVIVPGRITLDKIMGQFDQLVGMYAAQAKLWALQVHAVMREVFGETWVQATAAGGLPEMVTQANPYDGTVGVIRDGTVQQFRVQSSQGPNQAIDRLERNIRTTGGIPAEMGGESASNVRTGRRGGQVFSAAVDFYVAEHQNILAASLEEEDKAAIAIVKGYWPDEAKTFLLPLAKGQVTYTPSTTFDTDSHSVSYAYAGSDANTLVVGGGQRVAQQTLSKKSFMAIDPMVNDVDAEHDQIIAEAIESAIMQSVLMQAQQPDGPWQPDQLGRLAELVYTQDKEIWEAIKIIHSEAQQSQQLEAMAPGEQGQQPGLAQAGAPGTAQAAIPPANASQVNLSTMLMNLRNPQRRINEGST